MVRDALRNRLSVWSTSSPQCFCVGFYDNLSLYDITWYFMTLYDSDSSTPLSLWSTANSLSSETSWQLSFHPMFADLWMNGARRAASFKKQPLIFPLHLSVLGNLTNHVPGAVLQIFVLLWVFSFHFPGSRELCPECHLHPYKITYIVISALRNDEGET